MSDREIVQAMADAFDEWWHDELSGLLRVDCCILCARLSILTLKGFGVKAHPIATEVIITNPQSRELIEVGTPLDAWPDWAWSIGVGSYSSGSGWPGHLYAATDELLIDLSARQFDRPGRLHFPRSLVIDRARLRTMVDGCWLFVDERKQALMITTTTDRRYRNTPDWTVNPRPLVAELTRRTRMKLDRSG